MFHGVFFWTIQATIIDKISWDFCELKKEKIKLSLLTPSMQLCAAVRTLNGGGRGGGVDCLVLRSYPNWGQYLNNPVANCSHYRLTVQFLLLSRAMVLLFQSFSQLTLSPSTLKTPLWSTLIPLGISTYSLALYASSPLFLTVTSNL